MSLTTSLLASESLWRPSWAIDTSECKRTSKLSPLFSTHLLSTADPHSLPQSGKGPHSFSGEQVVVMLLDYQLRQLAQLKKLFSLQSLELQMIRELPVTLFWVFLQSLHSSYQDSLLPSQSRTLPMGRAMGPLGQMSSER